MSQAQQRVASAKAVFSNPQTLLESIRIENREDSEDAGIFGAWSNKDLDPTPPWQRVWSTWSFFAFQFSIAFSPTTYNVGASLYAIGLNWWIILIASCEPPHSLSHDRVIVSFLVGGLLWLNSRGAAWCVIYPSTTALIDLIHRFIGTIWDTQLLSGYPPVSMGLWFLSSFDIVAILYMAIQTLYASYFVNVMLRCVFGHKWTDLPNHLPETAGITSGKLVAFLILWLLQFPFAFIHPSKMSKVFMAKSIIAPIGMFATMIWALVTSHGADIAALGPKTVSGAALGWSFMKAINSIVSNVIPPLVNIPDLARYASRPRDTLPLPVGLVLSKPLVVFLGMVITAAGQRQFGEAYWNMWDFYSSVLDHYWSPGSRTVVFLAAGIQAFATFATNLTSNSIPVGCDLAGLFPRYFTIVRGQILCFILVWPVVPWKLTYSASSFLTFLNSYLCFICPIVAVMIVDYWITRRGNIHVPSLYNTEPGSPYFYTYGFNLRAFAAWLAAIILVIPGVSGALHPGSIGQAAVHIYNMGFLLSTTFAALVYYICCKIWPVQLYPRELGAKDDSWEAMRYTEGFFPEDEVVPEYLQETIIEGQQVQPSKALLQEKVPGPGK
ncbi:uncharacterized protein N7459_007596 [Penicillium hispanicum]|uniref:uncharacterized protein n=1 Tax=Penicillium hispanicum TaxID=1080232 RepID=UPI0025417B78|nr:uncharacterized protein N7459_007596 [Penicillium hispanicum]KAJ5578632.1 hypothetical protein N7459_007596 [Penicillium hispanicum]